MGASLIADARKREGRSGCPAGIVGGVPDHSGGVEAHPQEDDRHPSCNLLVDSGMAGTGSRHPWQRCPPDTTSRLEQGDVGERKRDRKGAALRTPSRRSARGAGRGTCPLCQHGSGGGSDAPALVFEGFRPATGTALREPGAQHTECGSLGPAGSIPAGMSPNPRRGADASATRLRMSLLTQSCIYDIYSNYGTRQPAARGAGSPWR